MAARDRYSVDIICPNCGEIGALHISEADHPYIRSPDREVDGVTGNFNARTLNEVKIEITCKTCGTIFPWK